MGFASPVNYAVNLAQQIIDGKAPTHAQLGVSLSTVNEQMAQRYGLPADTGAYVAAVNSGSGAEEAGIQVGDIITAFDGEAVESASDLMLDVRSKNPGDKVTLTVNRGSDAGLRRELRERDAAAMRAVRPRAAAWRRIEPRPGGVTARGGRGGVGT